MCLITDDYNNNKCHLAFGKTNKTTTIIPSTFHIHLTQMFLSY